MRRLSFLSLPAAVAVLALSACASPEPAKSEAELLAAQPRDCQKTIGTSICRRSDQGAITPAVSVSGDALRRSGTELVPPPPPGRGTSD